MKPRTQLVSGYVLVLVLMIVMPVVGYRGLTSLIDTADLVSHTHEVISEAYLMEKLPVDMETGQRGS